MAAISCNDAPQFDPQSVDDAGARISHVEPLSWWTGMRTPLQLMIHGDSIAACDVRIEGPQGLRVADVHKAESPNYLFVDVEVARTAEPGTRYLVFSREGETFKVPYDIAARREGSAARQSFTTADMIYLLMPDRFADGDPSIDSTSDTAEKADRSAFFGRHGGDLQGMIDRLGYIAGLGATAVWATPLLLDNEPEGSYHGYACADYYRIDPRFGTNGLYRDYVAACHRHGLKAVMDIVTNHCGGAHWWMADLPFGDWVHRFAEYTQTNNLFSTNMDPNASRYDLGVQESGWFDRSMPDMNLDNPFVLRYFQQWAVWWIEFADLDGLRVDTYPYNEKLPMSEWCAAVLREYPGLNIVGECWTSDVPQLAYWQGGNPNRDGFDSQLPSIMDFPLLDAVRTALPTDSLRWGEGMIRVYNALSDDFVYHDLSRMMIFPGNHDTERLADVVRGDAGRVKIAMTLMATLRGIPQLLAGDELMFRSADVSQGHGGLRVDFPGGWQGDAVDLFDPAQRQGAAAEVYDHASRLFNWRKTKPVIHSGQTLHFASRDNTYAYFRYNDSDAVFVFINNSRGRKAVPWSHYAEITESLSSEGRDVLTGNPVVVSDSTFVAPRSSLVVEFRRNARP